MAGSEFVQVVVVDGVAVLGWVNEEQARLPKAQKRGVVVQAVVIIFGVVGLRRVDEEQAGSSEKAICLECITNRLFKTQTFWSCLKAQTFWPRLIERKLNSLKRSEVVQEVVTFGVVGLRRVDEEQAGSPERALRLVKTNRLLKAQTIWSRLIERKLNSLKRGRVVQVVVAFKVVGLRRVDEEQAGPPETVAIARLFR